MYTNIITIRAYIFNSGEECRLCKNSRVVHLPKIAPCAASWWRYGNTANERAGPVWSSAFDTNRPASLLITGATDRSRLWSCSFFPRVNCSRSMVHICHWMNTGAGQRSEAAPQTSGADLFPARASGNRAGHRGPPPQALRILGGRCLRGDLRSNGKHA